MASLYSDLKIELIGTGEQVGTWGTTTNTNLGTALEEAITGSATVSFSSADVTLTLSDTNGTQTARNLRLVCSGTSGGARQLILDSGCQINKLYLIQNDLADTVTVINGDGAGGTSGTGTAVPAGRKQFVFNDGTNVVVATTAVIDLTTDVTGTLPIANGGTNSTATPTSGGVVYGTGSAYAITSAGTTGYALVSNGSSAPSWQNVASANTAGAIVERDGSGNFSAGTITATTFVGALTGAASALVTSNDYRVDSFGVGTNASGTTGEIRATNNVTAYYSSDARLKKNVVPLENALSMLDQIRGVRYDWTDEYMKSKGGEDGVFVRQHDVGVIAQEVEKVLPEIVAENSEGYKAVRYERIVPLLIEAIKELSEKCDNLQAEVNRLKGG